MGIGKTPIPVPTPTQVWVQNPLTHPRTLLPSPSPAYPLTILSSHPPHPHTLTFTCIPLALACTRRLMPSHLCTHLIFYSCPCMHLLSHAISSVHLLNLLPLPSSAHPFTLALIFIPTHPCLCPCALSLAHLPYPQGGGGGDDADNTSRI